MAIGVQPLGTTPTTNGPNALNKYLVPSAAQPSPGGGALPSGSVPQINDAMWRHAMANTPAYLDFSVSSTNNRPGGGQNDYYLLGGRTRVGVAVDQTATFSGLSVQLQGSFNGTVWFALGAPVTTPGALTVETNVLCPFLDLVVACTGGSGVVHLCAAV
jgi:hypothetical protein